MRVVSVVRTRPAAAGMATGAIVRVIAPQVYRTTLAQQLHAASVLTDSDGVQREATWLDVPCLVPCSTTEWVEVGAGNRGCMRIIGLDTAAGFDALAELAPVPGAEAEARTRAAERVVPAAAIVAALLGASAGSGHQVPPRRPSRTSGSG